jgi:FkbM family methyltransferase
MKQLIRFDRLEISLSYPKPVGDITVLVRTNEGSDAFIFGEVFDHQYYGLGAELPHLPETILDLGANVGFATLYFSRTFPGARLACVEPVPDNFNLLTYNLRLNDVKAVALQVAVGATDGTARMLLHTMAYAHQVIPSADCPAGEAIEVRSMSVPSILRELGWSRVGLLKVDIEGHEIELFKSDCSWLNRVDAMCIEWHTDLASAKVELADLAERFGFDAPRLLPGIWLLTRGRDTGGGH